MENRRRMKRQPSCFWYTSSWAENRLPYGPIKPSKQTIYYNQKETSADQRDRFWRLARIGLFALNRWALMRSGGKAKLLTKLTNYLSLVSSLNTMSWLMGRHSGDQQTRAWDLASAEPSIVLVLLDYTQNYRQRSIVKMPTPSPTPALPVFRNAQNKKAELSQRRPRDAPIIWVPWKISTVLTSPRGYFSRNL